MRKIIILLKYSQEYARQLKIKNSTYEIEGRQKVNLNKEVKWNSTCESQYILFWMLAPLFLVFYFYFIFFKLSFSDE